MLTPEDKQLIAEYMGWTLNETSGQYEGYDGRYYSMKDFNLNDAGLVVQEMQKRGEDWREFHNFARNLYYTTNRSDLKIDYNFVAWLFNADNFFSALAAWLKEEKE